MLVRYRNCLHIEVSLIQSWASSPEISLDLIFRMQPDEGFNFLSFWIRFQSTLVMTAAMAATAATTATATAKTTALMTTTVKMATVTIITIAMKKTTTKGDYPPDLGIKGHDWATKSLERKFRSRRPKKSVRMRGTGKWWAKKGDSKPRIDFMKIKQTKWSLKKRELWAINSGFKTLAVSALSLL